MKESTKEQLETQILKYQLLVNGLTYLSVEKNLENDALALQVRNAIKELIRESLKDSMAVI